MNARSPIILRLTFFYGKKRRNHPRKLRRTHKMKKFYMRVILVTNLMIRLPSFIAIKNDGNVKDDNNDEFGTLTMGLMNWPEITTCKYQKISERSPKVFLEIATLILKSVKRGRQSQMRGKKRFLGKEMS